MRSSRGEYFPPLPCRSSSFALNLSAVTRFETESNQHELLSSDFRHLTDNKWNFMLARL